MCRPLSSLSFPDRRQGDYGFRLADLFRLFLCSELLGLSVFLHRITFHDLMISQNGVMRPKHLYY